MSTRHPSSCNSVTKRARLCRPLHLLEVLQLRVRQPLLCRQLNVRLPVPFPDAEPELVLHCLLFHQWIDDIQNGREAVYAEATRTVTVRQLQVLMIRSGPSVPESFLTLALNQRLSEPQSPSMLGGRVRYLVLPELHLDVRQSPAQGMEWNAVVHLRVQIVWLIIPHTYVAGPAQGSEHRAGKAAVKMAGESDLPGPWFAG